jgi:uncharacterized LabA/DUF88 family protein
LLNSANRSRTIVYIDGFNLYYGLRDAGLRPYYWLDLRKLALRLVRSPFVLDQVKYFTARISGAHPDDTPARAKDREASRLRQVAFLEAVATLPRLDIFEGHFLLKRDYCRSCRRDFFRAEEKMTDVQLATQFVADAFLDRFDSAVIVSADSDLVPPIGCVQAHFPNKRILVAFPPERSSGDLKRAANWISIWPSSIKQCQMPDSITKADGVVLKRPNEWR